MCLVCVCVCVRVCVMACVSKGRLSAVVLESCGRHQSGCSPISGTARAWCSMSLQRCRFVSSRES